MNKIFLALFTLGFFLDFSFIPSLLGSNLSGPYTIFSLIVLSFLFDNNIKNIFWGTLGVILLNIIEPFGLLSYTLIIVSIWIIIYFLENLFFNEKYSLLKNNFIFIISFVSFKILLFLGRYAKDKLAGGVSSRFDTVNLIKISINLFIGILIFNLIYKIVYQLCAKDTEVSK